MKNNEVAKIYVQIADLMMKLSKLYAEGETESSETKEISSTPAKDEKKKSKKSAEKKVEKPVAEKSEGAKTEDELNDMSFNELKKYAASIGVDAKGKRADIIARILGGAEETAEPEAEEKSAKKGAKKSAKKSDDKVVDLEEKRDEIAEYEEMADEILEENDADDVITELKEAGLKGVTKRNVKKKLIEALKKGLLDLDEDEDEEDTTEESDADDEGEVVDENTYFEDFDDDDGANDPNNVVEKARKIAMVETQAAILEDIENEDLDIDEMKSFLLESSTEDEQDEIEAFDEDEVIAAYCELMKRYVDDEGDDYSDSDDPYYVNGEVYAHGHKCAETDGEYFDEVSGESFELED